jgi:hypothetical protein
MSTSRGARLAFAAAILGAWGCTTILGDFDVVPAAADAGPTQQQQPGADAATTTEGGGPAVTSACEQATDCPEVAMQPAACARAECKDHACVYTPVDKDGDGVAIKGCTVAGSVLPGEDCADDDPTVFPGGACSKLSDGSTVTFPNGTPLGACKAGKWECSSGAPVCQGAVAPAPEENCTLKNDANCNGVPDDGCDCTPNTTGPCGNVDSLPLPCKGGQRTCSAAGKWGDCIGNIEPSPRDCSSNVDNDCNGSPDRADAACSCPGAVSQGQKATCTVPGAKGVCADGMHVCVPSPDKQTGVFDACAGPAPGTKQCGSPADFDCDGVSDELQAGCGSPCLDPLGTGTSVAAAQKFSPRMWGCPGRRNWPVRGAGCAGGWSPCSVNAWVSFNHSTNAKIPTHKYWVAEQLGWGATAPPACYVPSTGGSSCGTNSSMTVCPYAANGATVTDPEGNTCNWSGCSYGSAYTVNDYLGGCAGTTNETGGTLCCQ